MRKLLTLLIVAILATTTASAADYTIVFGNAVKSVTAISSSIKSTSAIKSGTEYLTASPFSVKSGKCYYGDNQTSIRLGKSGAGSSLQLALSESGKVKATSITVNCKQFNSSNSGTLDVNDLGAQSTLSVAGDLIYKFTTPTEISNITLNSTKATFVYSITVTYEDESSKNPTTLSFGADLDGKAITKNLGDADFTHAATLSPAIEGATVTYTSSDENVAIVVDGEVALGDKAGSTTIKAEYAGNDTYASATASYKLHVKDNKIAEGTYSIPVTNWLWGTNYNGAVSDATDLNGSANGVSINLQKLGTTAMEVTDDQTLAGNGYAIVFNAPTGYAIQKINFTKGNSWAGNLEVTEGGGSLNGLQWVGASNTVSLCFGGKCYIKAVDVTYVSMFEKTATTLSFGEDLDGKTITKYIGETESSFTHAATLSPAVDGATISYTSSNESVALVSEDGSVVVANSSTDPEGTAVITAKYAGNDTYEASEASYTIDVKKLASPTFSPEPGAVVAGTEVTISAPEGATIAYLINDGEVVESESDTKTITINEATTILAHTKYKGLESEDVIAEYTIKAAYTYKWMVNGSEVQTSNLYEGDDVMAPAIPTSIGAMVFTGWVTTSTVDNATEPEYAVVDTKATANRTYYAVFATQNGTPVKWTKRAASEITEEGVYALITTDGHAFNGSISKGHGQATAEAFAFENNVASAAPEGICELTFISSGNGYKMYSPSANQYLISTDASSGSLKWNNTDDSYWYYYSNNWMYESNATRLRAYKNSSFRTYGADNGDILCFAQKTGGNITYSNFTTIVESTLAELANSSKEGYTYTVKGGDMVAVAKFEVADKHYVVVKDNATAVKNLSAPADGDKFFDIAGQKQQDYTQNNWMLVEMPVEQYNTVEVFKSITSISGTLTDTQNIGITASAVVMGEASEPFTISAYCPVNFMGVSSVASNNAAHPASYYFATPKANEYARIVWAVYNGTDGAFYIPAQSGSVNTQDFKGGFKVDFSMNVEESPELTDGSMYEFEAVVREAATSDSQSAPRKVEYDSTVAPSSKYVVYPINLQGSSNVVTGVSDIAGAKAVKSVRYFSVTGVEAAQPFEGVNIVVTTYTDGTSSAQKMLR